MDRESRDALRRWFSVKKPSFPLLPCAIGAMLAVPGLGCFGIGVMSAFSGGKNAASAAVGSSVMGLLPLAAGLAVAGIAIFLFMRARAAYAARPTDEEVDALIEQDLRDLNQRALTKTGTDSTELVGESVFITGPRLWGVSAPVAYRKGQDGVIRFSPVGVTILNFTRDQVIAYSCALDLFSGNPLNESTDEYFYRDIVSVSTKTKSHTYQVQGMGMVQMNSAETFELTTSGGTSVEVVLRDPGLIKRMGGGDIPTTRAEKAIQTMRKMLREKKGVMA